MEEKAIFTATVTDPGGISRMRIYINGKKVEECTGSPCTFVGGFYPLFFGVVSRCWLLDARYWIKMNKENSMIF